MGLLTMHRSNVQDIDAWISMVEDERGSLFDKILNRLACPFMTFKSTDEWLRLLRITREAEIKKAEIEEDAESKRKGGQTK